MTAQTVESVTTNTDQVVIVEKGTDLARILANVLPCAGRDDTLPILTAVHVDVTADRITVAATDRYTLATDYIDREKDEAAWPEVSFNLHRDDVTKIVKMVKGEKTKITSSLTIMLEAHGRVTASTWSGGITSQLVDGEFPNYGRVFPTEPIGVDGWSFAGVNASYVARFAKIMGDGRKPSGCVKLSFYGENNRKPILVTALDSETFRGLIMPIRISD